MRRTFAFKLLLAIGVVAAAFAVGASVSQAAVTTCVGAACPATTTRQVTPSNVAGNVNCVQGGFPGNRQVAFTQTQMQAGGATIAYSIPSGPSGSVTATYNTTTGEVTFSITGGAGVQQFRINSGGAANSTNVYSYSSFTGGGVLSDTGLFYPGPTGGVFACLTPATVLAVTAHSFHATYAGRRVMLGWRTASEQNVLGFNVYRKRDGKLIRLNKRIVAAVSLTKTATSHSYSFRALLRSRKLAATSRYVLAEVHTNGSRTLYGPVRASAAS